VNVLHRLTQPFWQNFVQLYVVLCRIMDSILNELTLGAFFVCAKPRQIKSVVAESHQVEQRLVIVTWLHDLAPQKLTD